MQRQGVNEPKKWILTYIKKHDKNIIIYINIIALRTGRHKR